MASVDDAFRGVGTRSGMQIWCVHNSRLVPTPKSSYGKFFSGNSYVVLNTVSLKSGVPQHDIHYWVGKDSKEADAALASDKVIELDAALGSCTVQYREVQGHETGKFLSYFKPCIIPIEGIFSSEAEDPDKKTYKVCLLRCKGENTPSVKEVPFSRSSLNHNDVFILDTEAKVFLFCGTKSSIPERTKALEVVQYVIDNKHGGRCEISNIEDGRFVDDPDAGEFWSLFGGYAPLPRDSSGTNQMQSKIPEKLFWINKGKICPVESARLDRAMLNSNRCYMLDCGDDIFVWMGRKMLVTERKMSISATEDLVRSQGRSLKTHIIFLTEGSETAQFKSHFDEWPQTVPLSLYEEGREKVAAIFKYQGYDVKELPEDNYQPLIDCSGTIKVWLLDWSDISIVPAAEQGKLYSGNCYIVQYSYLCSEREENLYYAWFGRNSTTEDRVDAVSHMSIMVDTLKDRAVMAQIFEGKEPVQFFAVLKSLIIFKGGTSSGYKASILERGFADETYDKDKRALFRVQGSGPENMQAIQVDLVSGSLNSSYCYILQDEAAIYAWAGNLSSERDHVLLNQMVDLIDPVKQLISVREGSEPDTFWNAIGGKTEYPKEKEIKGFVEDPHLFSCVFKEGDMKLQAKEIFNYSQDDLNTEHVLILDCYNEIYVWVGLHAGVTSKQDALNIGKKFLEADVLLEGLSPETAIYVIAEGNEPPFFTCFFEWDSSKACTHGNSFERKLAILKGLAPQTPRSPTKSNGRYDNGRKGNSSDRSYMGSVSPASSVLSDSEVPKNRRWSSPTLISREFDTGSPTCASKEPSELSIKDSFPQTLPEEELDSNLAKVGATVNEGIEIQDGLKSYPYELLKVPSKIKIPDIDVSKREAYLSKEEFQEKFRMTKEAFYKLPLWKQNQQKVALNLF